MERYKKLQSLKLEISRLFADGFDENVTYNRLHADSNFVGISRDQILLIYEDLQKESQAEDKNQRQIAETESQLADFEQHLAEVQKDQAKTKGQIAKRERRIAGLERSVAKAQDEKIELERVVKHQQSTSDHLICEFTSTRVDFVRIWQGRFCVKNGDDVKNMLTIEVQDMFQNTSKAFSLEMLSPYYDFYVLKFPFLLVYDEVNSATNYYYLAKLDFENGTLQVVDKFEHFDVLECDVWVDSSDPTKFLLHEDEDKFFECELVDNQIKVGDQFILSLNPRNNSISYFGNRIYQFQYGLEHAGYGQWKLVQAKMLIHSLERNDNSTIDLDPTSSNLNYYGGNNPLYCAWIRDSVFISVQFPFTCKNGVIFTNSQTRSWNIIEFGTDFLINYIRPGGGESLMICTKEDKGWNEPSKHEVFKFSMQKPDSLRNMAWLKVVKAFKSAKVEDLYKEARCYLPFTSEIQPFMLPKSD